MGSVAAPMFSHSDGVLQSRSIKDPILCMDPMEEKSEQQQQQQQQHSLCPKLTGVGYMDQTFPLCSIKCN
ncbi:hypothetical protein Syun_018426 [Stephania yunnanensis]|uniref:Uncharacterized protein n=1 Tax=Stephania yunnanensis TaxID=152371 RepID=A0AAP0IS99_9MAGN